MAGAAHRCQGWDSGTRPFYIPLPHSLPPNLREAREKKESESLSREETSRLFLPISSCRGSLGRCPGRLSTMHPSSPNDNGNNMCLQNTLWIM